MFLMLMARITKHPFREWNAFHEGTYCELNEGKLPSLKRASVILLTHDKSHSLLFACHLTREV